MRGCVAQTNRIRGVAVLQQVHGVPVSSHMYICNIYVVVCVQYVSIRTQIVACVFGERAARRFLFYLRNQYTIIRKQHYCGHETSACCACGCYAVVLTARTIWLAVIFSKWSS